MTKQRLQKLAGILTEASEKKTYLYADPMRQILLYPLFKKAFEEMDKSTSINSWALGDIRNMDFAHETKWNNKVDKYLQETFPEFSNKRIEVIRNAYWDYKVDGKKENALRDIFNNKQAFPQKWEYYRHIFGYGYSEDW